MSSRRRPALPARSPTALPVRSDLSHRPRRRRSLPTIRPIRQSISRLLLLDACGRCTRTTFTHPERSSHPITRQRTQSPHLSLIGVVGVKLFLVPFALPEGHSLLFA